MQVRPTIQAIMEVGNLCLCWAVSYRAYQERGCTLEAESLSYYFLLSSVHRELIGRRVWQSVFKRILCIRGPIDSPFVLWLVALVGPALVQGICRPVSRLHVFSILVADGSFS